MHKHIFICGLHRSGTSILHKILMEHSDISGFSGTHVPEDEGQHLQNIFNAANKYGGAGEFCFHKNAYMDENHPLATQETYSKLMSQWGEYWDLTKPVLLEKSPPNVIRSRFFNKIFPNSYFIFIIRDPISVTLATAKWSDNSTEKLLEHWLKAAQIIENDMQQLPNAKLLRYEDLIDNPQQTINDIYQFVGIKSFAIKTTIKSGINNKYQKQWQELNIDASKFGAEFAKYGYDL